MLHAEQPTRSAAMLTTGDGMVWLGWLIVSFLVRCNIIMLIAINLQDLGS
jgi:hypothetical protein